MQVKRNLWKPVSRLALLVFCIECIGASANGISAEQPVNASHRKSKAVPVIELTGDSYNRGLQHGTKLKAEIAAVYAKWKQNIRATIKGDPDSMLTVFRKATNFLPIIEKRTPGLLQEVRGIADGSGQTFEDVFVFQLLDEFWVYLNKQSNIENHHCSGIGVSATANHPAYIAQNMDLEAYMQGFQVILHLTANKNEPEQYLLSCAGLIGLNGMNANGIGLCVNTLMELRASEDGLPVAFVIRGVLSEENGKSAMNFLKTVKHASGQNYILGITDSVYNFEASANQVVRFLPRAEESGIVYHTNHAIVNHDVKEWYKKSHEQFLRGELNDKNSEVRFASLQQRLNALPTGITTEVIKATLQSKDNEKNPVCRVYKEKGGAFTFSSVLFTLGGKRSVQFTFGSPDQSEYKEYFFKPVK